SSWSMVPIDGDVRKTVESIPRPPEESGVIEISLMRRMEYKNAYLKEMIRPADVWAAARLLCDTPLYKRENITMNPAMDPNLLSSTATDDMNALRIADLNRPEEPVPGPSELGDRHLPEETLLDSTDAVRFAPGEGENPIPMYMDPYCEELAFPTIWFGHPRGVPPKDIRLSFLDHINSEIRRFDRRACRPDHILFLHKKAQIEQLTKQVNIVLRKSAQTNNITAAQVRNKQFIDNAVNNDSAYRFMSAITGSPAYFEAQKKKIMATVRQTGGFTFFITMSAAETHWPELLVILKKTVDKEDITEEQAMELTFEEKARLISNDPSTCALYYNYRLRENWKLWEAEDGPFLQYKIGGKTCRIEFQHRGSPHAHQFILLVDAPKFDSDDPESYGRVIEFIDKMITTDTDDPEVADIIYSQRHRCTHTCRKGKKGKETCRFNAPFLPMPRTMILEPIPDSMELSKEKQDRLKDINKKLHNILEADSASIQSFDELLQRLECNFDDYLLAARSKLKSRKVFIKREPKNSRINPYNKKILITMRSNMDIQFILDIYSCISYVVDYVNKSDKGLSRLLRKCVEEYKNGNASIKSKLSAMSKIMYNSSETSAQEASWIRSRLPMCMSTDVVEFISSGPKATRQLMLKSNAELERIAESNPDSTDIYKKGPIDRYADRPNELEDICLADFIAHYTYHTRGKQTTTDNDDDAPEDEQLEVIDGADIDEHTIEKKRFDLKNNSGYITIRKRPKIIRYVRFNRHEDEVNYFREMVLLFLPWRNEDEEVESQDCAKKFEENEAVIKRNYDKYNAVSLDIDAILQEIQNERIAEENIEAESNNRENVDPNFLNAYDFDDNIVPNAAAEMGLEAPGADITASRYQVPNMIRDDEYFELCDSLNTLQRDFLMHLINDFKSGSNLPVYYFLSGGAGVGKSRLINAIYQSIVRLYRSEPGSVDSNEVLLVAYTGMAAHNIGGITAHSAFHLSANQGKTDVGLSPDIANTMACQLQRLKLIIIDEISMLGAEHFDQISSNLKQAFRSTREFAGRSVIVVGDFNQLRPVGASYVFTNKKAHHRNSLTVLCENPQWSPFRLFELTEIMRQKDDLRFAEALTRLAYGRTTAEDNSMISSRCFSIDEDSLPLDVRRCLRLIATNKEVDMFNSERARQMVNDGAQKYTFTAVDSFVGTYTNSQKNKARHELEVMDKKNTQNLIRQLDLIIGLRYMVSTNIDVSDGLFNGASGILRFVEISNRKINCVYIEFDDESIGGKTRASRYQVMTTNHIIGKSRLINAIYQSIVRLYRSEPGPVDSNEVLLVAYTGMAAHNIGGITAHSAFHLSANQGKTDVGLSPDIANTMACQLQRLKLIIIDEISMLGAEHFDQISLNLKQAFRSTREFAGRSVIVVGDFNQLRPVGASYVFTNKRTHHRNSLTVLCENPQWSPFRLFELTEIMRQKDDLRFAEALTRLAYGRTTAEDNSMISSRCFNDEDSLPLDVRRCLRLIATNKEVDMFNSERARQMVNDGAQKYTFTAVDSFVGTYTNSQKNKARHELEVMDKKNTQNLIRQLDLIIGLRYMVSTNIDVSDGLFNGASGILRFVEISNRKINCVYIEFDDESIGGKTRASRYQAMTTNHISNRWTPIKTTKKSFYTCQGGSVQVAREQFPLVMAEAITIHKSQGRSESKIVIDVRNPSKTRNHMDRQKWYVALSRARSLNGLYILGTFKPPSEIKPNDEVNAEMNRLRQNPLVP
ncbi:putative ATP-dependent DNA helicase PIF1, partial [Polypedilum vanderplanki]